MAINIYCIYFHCMEDFSSSIGYNYWVRTFYHCFSIFYCLLWLWFDECMCGLKYAVLRYIGIYRFLVYAVYALGMNADASSVEYSVGMGQASSWHQQYFSQLFLIFTVDVDFLYFCSSVNACLYFSKPMYCIADMYDITCRNIWSSCEDLRLHGGWFILW
jgi:hypothetical protein